jgi:hypothetical protein
LGDAGARRLFWAAIASVVLACSGTTGRSGSSASAECSDWLERTVRGCESVAVSERYGYIVESLRDACTAVPAPIRAIAARIAPLSSRQAQATPLADAATFVLGSRCRIADPQASASDVVAVCPAGTADFPLAGRALADIRAADWALLVALQTSLIDRGAYDADAKRLMLHLALSSALLGEQERAADGRSSTR